MVENKNVKPNIVIISGTCCSPAFEEVDKQTIKNLEEALKHLEIKAEISLAPVTELVQATNLSWVALEKAYLMFKKYGIKMCPAIVFDDDVVFVGGIPTVEQIEEKLSEAYLG